MYLLEGHLYFGNAVGEFALEALLPGLVSHSSPVRRGCWLALYRAAEPGNHL